MSKNKTNNEGKESRKGLRISKVVILSVLKIGLPVLFGIFLFVELFSLIEKKNIQAQESSMVEENEVSVEVQSYDDNPLLLNEYPEVNSFVESYYKALADGDVDTVCAMQDEISDTEKITMEKKADYIEAYENIDCYTKNGLEDNSYFTFVVSDVKFYNLDATAPAMTVYYIYTTEDGSFMIDGNMDDISDVLSEVYEDPEVTDLFNKVDASYVEAVAADENLNSFLADLPSLLKTEVGEALALLESTQTTEISDDEVALTDSNEEETSETETETETVEAVVQVVALDTINVRSSDSSEADKIGKVSKGEVLTCLEQKINGWDKILYDGKEAYVKSTYVEVVTSAADGEVIGTVTANSNVNVRSAASQDASKLGVASAGTVYNLLEDLGEWYHIDYEGNNGYVKAEYFTK